MLNNLIKSLLIASAPTFAAIPTLAPQSQIDSELIEHSYQLDSTNFQNINIDGNIQLDIQSGETALSSFTEGDEKPDLYLNIEDGILYISQAPQEKKWTSFFNWRSSDDRKNIQLKLTLPRLETIRMHSMSAANVQSPFALRDISLSGASKLNIEPKLSSNTLNVKLRGFSRLHTTGINVRKMEVNQSGMSTFNADSISTQSFSTTTHGECMQHIAKLESRLAQFSLTGQARSDIDNSRSDAFFVYLHGSSVLNAITLKTKALEASLTGSSELDIRQGSAQSSKLQTFNNANYRFGGFNPGKKVKIDTTRDAKG